MSIFSSLSFCCSIFHFVHLCMDARCSWRKKYALQCMEFNIFISKLCADVLKHGVGLIIRHDASLWESVSYNIFVDGMHANLQLKVLLINLLNEFEREYWLIVIDFTLSKLLSHCSAILFGSMLFLLLILIWCVNLLIRQF